MLQSSKKVFSKKVFSNILNVTDSQLSRVVEIRLKMHYLEISTIELQDIVDYGAQYLQGVLSCNNKITDKFYNRVTEKLDYLIAQEDSNALCLITQLSHLKYKMLLDYKQQQLDQYKEVQ